MLAPFGLTYHLYIIQCHLGLTERYVKYCKPHQSCDRDLGFIKSGWAYSHCKD